MGRLEAPPRQRRSVSPTPPPRVEVAWTATEDPRAPDRLVAYLTGGGADTRTGRLCPRCGSARHGRPFLHRTDARAGERISIARTTGATLVAVSRAGAVGVDVERLDRFSDPSLAGVVLHPEERASGPDLLAAAWVRKEALLKMTGDGLAVEPARIQLGGTPAVPAVVRWPFDGTPGWLHDLPLAPGLVAAVAGEGERPAAVTVSEVAPEELLGRATGRTADPAPPRS